jgi:kynurenine formamidase
MSAAAFGGASLAERTAAVSAAAPASQTAQAAPAAPPAGEPLTYRRNWGRWGADDGMGAVNLITPQKRAAAAALVKTGRSVSLGRVFTPEQHFIRITPRGPGAASAGDYYGFQYHGIGVTHVDALCHVWDRNGMWNGRDPAKEIDTSGSRFADITNFGSGLVTRGVLLDVPRHRRTAHVTMDRPVTGQELETIAQAENVRVEPGDALFVYSGREDYVRTGAAYGGVATTRPGLDVSCARFVRDRDVSVLAWDMHDAMPNRDGLPWPMHGVIFSYGVALLDNALLEPLAQACAEERRYEFMFVALPLKVARGTGSPVNPIALF